MERPEKICKHCHMPFTPTRRGLECNKCRSKTRKTCPNCGGPMMPKAKQCAGCQKKNFPTGENHWRWTGGIAQNRKRFKETYARKHPLEIATRKITNNAIRRGDLIRQPCRVCGSVKSEVHHVDYNKPLDVMWLCKKHHLDLHYGKITL